jgi:hypothetical protein
MLLFWRIRYLDTTDRQFKDRDLWLNTDDLDPMTKAEVELCQSTREASNDRGMLRYKHLFEEKNYTPAKLNELLKRCGAMSGVSIYDYFEDENGRELTGTEVARIVTASPTAFMVPPGAKQHDIDYMLADKPPIRLEELSLTNEQLTLLGYFARDLREMSESAFMKDGPGVLMGTVGGDPALETAVSDEEIRSFVTIFRRLYMQGEEFNFVKAATAASEILDAHPLGKWIKGAASEYESTLDESPHLVPFLRGGTCPFTHKRLIDVFLYTRYAHQPDVRRIRQFHECLEAVSNRRGVLTWLFLASLQTCSLRMTGPGRVIAGLYNRYCEHHGVTPDILESVASENPGIGTREKRQARIERLLGEKAEELARAIWEDKGRPDGGYSQFLDEAKDQLRATLE